MTDARACQLAAYGVSHRHGPRAVLTEVSFEIAAGEIMALLGPNGSGKSTLLKVLAGLLRARSGIIRFRGLETSGWSITERARYITYVGPEFRMEFPMTVREFVSLGRLCHGAGSLTRLSKVDEVAVDAALDRALCGELSGRDVHTLSGGERQLVALARALAQGARVLLLDEALSRMDLNHQARVGGLLRQLAGEDCSIILVAHDVNLAAEWSDTCLLLKEGVCLATGTIRQVLNEQNVRKLYPGADFRVGANPATGAPQVFFSTQLSV